MNVFSNVSNSFTQIHWQSEITRNVARNVVNGQNDNNDTSQQEENLAPVRYEHIVGHLEANINTRPQPVANNNVQQPQLAPAAQPVAVDDLPVDRSTNQLVIDSNIPAFPPDAQQNNPNPIFTVKHILGSAGYNLKNAPAMSRTVYSFTRIFTGYAPSYNQCIEIDTDFNNEDKFVFRNIPKVEISRGFQHYTFDDARVVRVKRSGSIDENDGQLHIDRQGNFRTNGQRN